jgi:hypothetical protein
MRAQGGARFSAAWRWNGWAGTGKTGWYAMVQRVQLQSIKPISNAMFPDTQTSLEYNWELLFALFSRTRARAAGGLEEKNLVLYFSSEMGKPLFWAVANGTKINSLYYVIPRLMTLLTQANA